MCKYLGKFPWKCPENLSVFPPLFLPSSFNSMTLPNRLGWPNLEKKVPVPNISLTYAVCLCVEWAGQLASLLRVKEEGAGKEPTDSWPTSIASLWFHYAIWLPVELKTWKAEDNAIWDSPCPAPEVPNSRTTRTLANDNSSPLLHLLQSPSRAQEVGGGHRASRHPKQRCPLNQVSRQWR